MPGSEDVSVIQGKDDDVVLLALETASELGMSKLLACCERYIALKPCNNFMAPTIECVATRAVKQHSAHSFMPVNGYEFCTA